MPGRFVRALVALGLLGPLFIVVFTWAGVIDPGYSMIREDVSDLAVGPTAVIQTANFVAFGVLLCLFGLGLRRSFGDPTARRGGLLIGAMGVGLFGLAAFQTDLSYRHPTFHGVVHGVVFSAIMLCFIAACWHFTRAFARDHRWGPLLAYTRVTGVTAPVMWCVLMLFGARGRGDSSEPLSAWNGLCQRALILVLCAWIVTVAAHHVRLHPLRIRPE